MPSPTPSASTWNILVNMGALFVTAARRLAIALPALIVAAGLAPVAVTWVTRAFIDEVAQAQPLRENLIGMAAAIAAFSAIAALLVPATSYVTSEIQRRLGIDIDVRIAQKLSSLQGIRTWENAHFFDRLQVAHQAGSQAGPELLSTSSQLLQSGATAIGFVTAIALVDPKLLTIIALGTVPALLIEPWLARKKVQATIDMGPLERRRMFFYGLMLMPAAAREIRAFGLGQYVTERMAEEYHSLNAVARSQSRREFWGQSAALATTSLAYGAALLLLVDSAVDGTIGPGDIALILAAITGVQLAMSTIVASLAHFHGAVLLFRQFYDVMALDDDLAVPLGAGPVTPGPDGLRSGIEFRDVWFRYADDQPWILQGLSMTIPAGQVVGLVGLNGAGKSTIAKLLLRLYDPVRGAVLWDGVDIRQFDVDVLRRNIAPVLQDAVAYDMTAHENIALGDVTRFDDRAGVKASARVSGIDERIDELPAGYDTLLSRMFAGDDSIPDLSGGEWRRLSISRGVFRLPASLVVLDEPTAFLDPAAEEQLFANLESAVGGHTSVLISHRFTSLRVANLIHLVAHGRVAETGTHDALVALGGEYARLYRVQLARIQRQTTEAESAATDLTTIDSRHDAPDALHRMDGHG